MNVTATKIAEDSPLLQLFSRLSGGQLRQLRLFLKSPYFNQREDVYALFKLLRKNQKRQQPVLAREQVFRLVCPGLEYDDGRLNLVIHLLLGNIKRFLALESFEKEERLNELYECQALRKANAEKAYKKSIRKLEKNLEKHPYRNVGFHYLSYQLQQEHYVYISSQRRAGRLNLEELVKELTVFYLSDILRHSCTILTAQRIGKEAYATDLLQEVLQYVERSSLRETPAISIYHQAYLLLSDVTTDTDSFEAFVQLIDENWQRFPAHEIRDIYLLAINYCIQRINRGQRSFIQRALALYKLVLEREILLEYGQLSKFTYNNILMLALASKEFDWAWTFLHQFQSKLLLSEREQIFHYNLAIYYFHKPDYNRALSLLSQQLHFDDVLYNLNSRSMLLQIYFELEMFDVLFAHLDSFTMYINRKKQLGYHRENYLKLISFVKKMLSLSESDTVAREALKASISRAEAVAEKKWLLSQL